MFDKKACYNIGCKFAVRDDLGRDLCSFTNEFPLRCKDRIKEKPKKIKK